MTVDLKNRVFIEKSPSGDIQLVDMFTGEVIAIQQNFDDDVIYNKVGEYKEIDNKDGSKTLIQRGLNSTSLKQVRRRHKYSHVLANFICQKVAEGETIKEISTREGFPSRSVIAQWEMEFPEFEEALEAARRVRAEFCHDEIFGMAKGADEWTKNDRDNNKVAAEMYKWLAEKNNNKRYGKEKSDVQSGGTTIIVNTGINRDAPIELNGESIDLADYEDAPIKEKDNETE